MPSSKRMRMRMRMRMRSKSMRTNKPIKKTRKGGANTYETIKSLSYTRSAKRDLSGPYNKMVRKKTPLVLEQVQQEQVQQQQPLVQMQQPLVQVQQPLVQMQVQQQQSPMKKKHLAITGNKVKGMVANIEQLKNSKVKEKLPAPRKKLV